MGSMQGVILDEMRMYVVDAFGSPTWSHVLTGSGRPANHSYLADQELGMLAMHTCTTPLSEPAPPSAESCRAPRRTTAWRS